MVKWQRLSETQQEERIHGVLLFLLAIAGALLVACIVWPLQAAWWILSNVFGLRGTGASISFVDLLWLKKNL